MTKLQEVRDLIADPGAWCQNNYAVTVLGTSVWSRSPEAVSWCLAGACNKVSSTVDEGGALFDVLTLHTMHGLTEFNDNHTHAEVLAFLDDAIAAEASC